MVLSFITNPKRNPYLWLLTFVSAFLIPFPVVAESESQSCTDTQKHIEQTQNALRPLEHRQQQLQQDVRIIYQKLFACHAGGRSSLAEQQHCIQLQEEGPKLFQAMIQAITLRHQTYEQLAHQTRRIQLACPSVTKHIPSPNN